MRGCRELVQRAVLALALGSWCGPAGSGAPGKVCLARVQGTIGPATATYLARTRGEAARGNAQCLIIELDTPGGLLESTKEIIQGFLHAPVPTVPWCSCSTSAPSCP